MPSYTEITKPSVSGYTDLTKPKITNYNRVAFFDPANAPFLDLLPFSLLGTYEPTAPTYNEILKPT
jgi:hypothetical protein